jgi:hypothetical protein
MTSKIEMGNVIIRPEDQSAPKEHWAEAEIRKAQADIDAGNFIPDPDPDDELGHMEGLGLALGAFEGKPGLEDFRRTHDEMLAMGPLSRHPRVVEAMERMQREAVELPGQEGIERLCMMREMATSRAHGRPSKEEQRLIDMGKMPMPIDQRFKEQPKLASAAEEESRYGLILTPEQFYDRLGKVTGKGRIKLSHHAVLPHPGARSGRVGLYIKNPEWKGDALVLDQSKRLQAMDLRSRAEHECAKAKRLRKLGLNAEADKAFNLTAEMVQAATVLLMEESAAEQLKPPELLRIATLQWPLGTEWMVCNFDEWGIATDAKFLGWRTALLSMIRCGAITEKDAHKAFPVGSGPAASWYLEQLAMWRNLTGTVQ